MMRARNVIWLISVVAAPVILGMVHDQQRAPSAIRRDEPSDPVRFNSQPTAEWINQPTKPPSLPINEVVTATSHNSTDLKALDEQELQARLVRVQRFITKGDFVNRANAKQLNVIEADQLGRALAREAQLRLETIRRRYQFN